MSSCSLYNFFFGYFGRVWLRGTELCHDLLKDAANESRLSQMSN